LTAESARPGALAAFGIRLRNTIIRRYSSRGARRYEARRSGRRWDAEARAFSQIYANIAPRSVLDCPVGTGRWFEHFRRSGASVVGVDISQNMLAEAARKIPPGADIRLERRDVLDPRERGGLGDGYDLIVCTRFVYWLRPAELAILLEKFRATGAPKLLTGAKVAIEERRGGSSGLIRLVDRLRARFYRKAIKRIYDEEELLGMFAEGGWRMAERIPVVKTRSMRYFYYLFERA
jgi:SAM-dependent methyltransferase